MKEYVPFITKLKNDCFENGLVECGNNNLQKELRIFSSKTTVYTNL